MKRYYVLGKNKYGKLIRHERQDGFLINHVEFEDGTTDKVYSSYCIDADRRYSNSEIWDIIEINDIQEEIVIKSHKGKMLAFDGSSFAGGKFEKGDRWILYKVLS